MDNKVENKPQSEQTAEQPVVVSTVAEQQADKPGLFELTIMTPQRKEIVHVSPTATVKDLKDEVGKKFKKTEDQLCLLFNGKILKDENTLSHHGIENRVTIHLVIKTKPNVPSQPANMFTSSVIPPSSSSSSAGIFTSILGSDISQFSDLRRHMEKSFVQNPEMMKNLFNSPLGQNIFSNPDFLSEIFKLIPQMRELIDNKPGFLQLIRNPGFMRYIMDELMSDVESKSTSSSSTKTTPFSDTNTSETPSSSATSQKVNQDNNQPLPNPSNPVESAPTSTPVSTSDSPGVSGHLGSQQFFQIDSSTESNVYRFLEQRLSQNPEMIRQFLISPMAQNIFSNTDLITGLIKLVPQTREFIDNNPGFLKLFQNPEFVRYAIEQSGEEFKGDTRQSTSLSSMISPSSERNTYETTSSSAASPDANIHLSLMQHLSPEIIKNLMSPIWQNFIPNTDVLTETMSQVPLMQDFFKNTASSTSVSTPAIATTTVNGTSSTTTNPSADAATFGTASPGSAAGSDTASALGSFVDPSTLKDLFPRLSQLIDDPMVQNLMTSPTDLREIAMHNPQTRAFYDNNPVFEKTFNDPSLMREMLKFSCAFLQELTNRFDSLNPPGSGPETTTANPPLSNTSSTQQQTPSDFAQMAKTSLSKPSEQRYEASLD